VKTVQAAVGPRGMILLESIEFWYWWVAAIAFIGIEVFAPGAFFLWMGVSAGLVGALVLAAPELDWRYQFLIFAVLSVVSAYSWRTYSKRHPPPETDQPALNRRGQRYVGRTFTLAEPIINGQGKLKVDDTIWKIEGNDLAAGTQVRVTGVDGTVLVVEVA
jgi:membrane protein implicated in regulation of membrane protease activity